MTNTAPLSNRQVKADGVDVLVDLHGYSLGTSTVWAGVYPFRAAPIQMHFHGQPQTTGSRYVKERDVSALGASQADHLL